MMMMRRKGEGLQQDSVVVAVCSGAGGETYDVAMQPFGARQDEGARERSGGADREKRWGGGWRFGLIARQGEASERREAPHSKEGATLSNVGSLIARLWRVD